MANINGQCYACHECAVFVNNSDTSHIEFYGAEYYADWCSRIPNGMVIVSPTPDSEESDFFFCDYCDRDMLSAKYKMEWVG